MERVMLHTAGASPFSFQNLVYSTVCVDIIGEVGAKRASLYYEAIVSYKIIVLIIIVNANILCL